ncbi:FAD-dependent monooxygenase [Bradyrhizobium sp. STM 3557]|uniref:FAD-dependent monooxygenase n=1 Tax=Bradyrhizobium sp. STM 3557 TaxID=578920 RepID=UPI00388D4AC9
MPIQVLIVGAGPTGLVLALWLTRLGVSVRIIDKTSEPGTTSRALAVQARTLELYQQLDLAETVVAQGHRVPAVNMWAEGQHAARVSLEDIGTGSTRYPFLHIFPQDQHERLLIDRLAQLGAKVERQTELLNFTDRGDAILARLRSPDGNEQDCEAHYIVGCDGARSLVRNVVGSGFPGGTYRQLFYVADVDASGTVTNGELHIDLDDADFLAVFPLADSGHVRLIGTVRDERADHAESLEFGDVSDRAIRHLSLQVEKVNWFSTYHVHHRVTEHFRKGRAFLAGDAAHIHSPAGGQGMNTGIGDAINLAWKLATVLAGRAPDGLLDTYEAERIGFARRLVATTDRAFSVVTAEGRLADVIRTRVAPVLLPLATRFEAVRDYMFRTVSQIMVNYHDSPLSRGAAGQIRAGDRLPWVAAGGVDNHAPLKEIGWQAHVYGEAKAELAAWCTAHGVGLHVFAWRPEHDAAGFVRDAVYLLRPDTYIAFADARATPDDLNSYFTAQQIIPASAP